MIIKMADIGNRIKQLRHEKGLTQEELGKRLGVQKAAVQKWESGAVKNLKRETLKKLSEIFEVSPAVFIESYDERPNISAVYTDEIYRIPVFESISAGFGAYADSLVVDYIPVFIKNHAKLPLLMGIKVQGDSMYPTIEDGDIIIVRRQSAVDSGSIAVMLIDGEEGVVKKIEHGKDWIDLISINPMYPKRHFQGEELTRIRVLGLVKQVIKEL
ncbi:MAG: XRE family transcriptional regulator [Ruminiclostridium sp.]|nr:XRE family transcriptional regulator [Ruminiclostridium sp.]